MPIRGYICPIIGTGTRFDPYRPRTRNYFENCSMLVSMGADGQPNTTWVVSFVKGEDFTFIDADPLCEDLFAGDLPANLETKADVVQFLRTRTLSDVPTNRRNAMIALLDKYGVIRTDLVGTTPVWKMVQRVASTLTEKNWDFYADL